MLGSAIFWVQQQSGVLLEIGCREQSPAACQSGEPRAECLLVGGLAGSGSGLAAAADYVPGLVPPG